MNENKNVSVIIPCYNVEKYLDRCLGSVVSQSQKNIEIILVDDCSNDATPNLCDRWAAIDSRIRVIHKKVNEGLGFARNTGLQMASGEYVAFVDSDDFINSEMLAVLYNYAFSNNLDAAYCGFNRVKDGKIKEVKLETLTAKICKSNDECRLFLKGMLSSKDNKRITDYEMSVWHAIYSRKLIKKYEIQFPSERILISEDIIFHIDFLSKANKIGIIPKALYNYCLNPVSLTTSFRSDRFEKVCFLYDSILQKVQENENNWNESDLCNFIALNLRFVISNCVENIDALGEKKCYDLVKKYSQSSQVKRWIIPYINFFPKRYKLFYLLLKLKFYKTAIWMVRIKK